MRKHSQNSKKQLAWSFTFKKKANTDTLVQAREFRYLKKKKTSYLNVRSVSVWIHNSFKRWPCEVNTVWWKCSVLNEISLNQYSNIEKGTCFLDHWVLKFLVCESNMPKQNAIYLKSHTPNCKNVVTGKWKEKKENWKTLE